LLPSSQKQSNLHYGHSERFLNAINLFKTPSRSKGQLSYHCHRVIIVARAPKFFEKLICGKSRPVDIDITSRREFDGEEMVLVRKEECDDDNESNEVSMEVEMETKPEKVSLNEVVTALILEVFLYYAYFEEAELGVFNNEQLLGVIKLCSKIAAQGLANVAMTELGKRLRKGQIAYHRQMYSQQMTEHQSHQQSRETARKLTEVVAETKMQIQLLMQDQMGTENESLVGDEFGGDNGFLENVLQWRRNTHAMSFMGSSSNGTPIPRGAPIGRESPDCVEHKSEESCASFQQPKCPAQTLNNNDQQSNNIPRVRDLSTLVPDDAVPREESTWWSPLHLIAKTQDWNIPQLQAVLINAHILIN